MKLNDMQEKAVKIVDGPILILAGAGSGKTRVLTERISNLILNEKIDPSNILAITFTNKAANEMKDRIINRLGSIAYNIQISTFHSFGLLILKENYKTLGFDKNFTILDSEDSLTIIKKIIKDNNYEENPKAIKSAISNNKNALLNPIDFERIANTDFDKIVLDVYKRYNDKLKINNSVDFDDLLMLPIELFRKNKDILLKYQEKYKYILIDEYQDTNEAQYLLTKMIGSKYKNICVVGDDSQSIYSWRGSNYQNILNFEKDYPKCSVIYLEQNYRSTKTILNASNSLIKKNINRKDKNLWTENETGDKLEFHQAINEKDEANYVVKEIKELIDNGVNRSEIAVLYRTNAQSRNIEEAFLFENIPYKVVGSFYFYNRKEIKDIIAYLKLIYNPYDEVSLRRIINVPKRKIGEKTIKDLNDKASELNISLYEAIESGKELEFKNLIETFRKEKDNLSLVQLVELVLDKSGILNEYKDNNDLDSEIKIENIMEFKSIASQFEENYGIISLDEFLESIALVSDLEEYRNNSDAVTLMTIHLAKGLEFDYVFVTGMEEEVFPHFNSLQSSNEIEEERRLCYVAITRARKKVWLVCANSRLLFGIKKNNKISRFVSEIDSECINNQRIEKKDIKTNITDDGEYKVGEHIIFEDYGEGVIVSIKERILVVAFQHPYGVKMLIKGHKKIRRI